MAAGDMKGGPGENIVIEVTAGEAIAKGDLVHIEADDKKWDKTANADLGKFGVAIEAASADGQTFRVCIYGPVEVTATNAAIGKGEYVEADAAQVKTAAMTAYGEIVGTAMEAFLANETKTIWIGLVG